MTRVKGGLTTRRKHKKVLKLAKGYWMTRHKQIKKAKEAVLHAGQYAFDGRKLKKRFFKKLWIMRLNSAVRVFGLTYSRFVKKLADNKVALDRKVLSQLAVEYPDYFNKLVDKIK